LTTPNKPSSQQTKDMNTIKYIDNLLSLGKTPRQIRLQMKANGFRHSEIENGLKNITQRIQFKLKVLGHGKKNN
jgi:hypothetical protein